MHLVHTSRLPALRRFWLISLAAAMLLGSTLAIAAPTATHGSDHKTTPAPSHEKSAAHASAAQKPGKAGGQSKKGSDGGSFLKVLQKAAKSQSSSSQDDQ
jgi:hypothetical protein